MGVALIEARVDASSRIFALMNIATVVTWWKIWYGRLTHLKVIKSWLHGKKQSLSNPCNVSLLCCYKSLINRNKDKTRPENYCIVKYWVESVNWKLWLFNIWSITQRRCYLFQESKRVYAFEVYFMAQSAIFLRNDKSCSIKCRLKLKFT